MDDEQIVKLFYARSESAIEALKEKYGSRATAVAMKILGNAQDAEETVNDALHVLWQQIPPEKPRHLWAYFSRVVRNLSCNRADYRTAARRQESCQVCLSELEDCLSAGGDPQKIFESRQITDAINRFLDGLSKENRMIFVRRYYYFDSCQEIGRRLGMSRSTVNTRLHRLRQQLRQALQQEGISV